MKSNKIINIVSKPGIILFIVCTMISFVFLLLCSRSSFLYPYNNWDDANSYFSMGKFMINGGVIYRDLYDQKGPYLYLIYGIAYLLSNNTFLGVFFLEILSISFFLFFGYKILCLYTTAVVAYSLLPLLAAAGLSSLSFYWGGAAEEFCLPFLMASLYCSLKYLKEDYPASPRLSMILWNGIFAGVILQLKYTLLGFYFAWMAVIALLNLTKMNWKKAIRCCLVFLGGMIVTMIPWLFYFGIHGALDDWFQCYVYNNVFLYSDIQKADTTILLKIYKLAKILYNLVWNNISYFCFIVIGFYFMIFSSFNHWYEKINTVLLFGFLFLGIYVGGGDIFYYSIPLMIFSVLGLGAIGRGINKVERKLGISFNEKLYLFLFFLTMIGGVCFANENSINTDYRKVEKKDHFLWEFEKIVNSEENPTLLNINMLDSGLYTVANILPTCKYFQTNGIDLEEMRREQERYIREGETLFVISRFEYPEYILENYELIAETTFPTDGKNESPYFLFRLRNR